VGALRGEEERIVLAELAHVGGFLLRRGLRRTVEDLIIDAGGLREASN
jgi:hypothetical protein